MAITERPVEYDGFADLLGGKDAGRRPEQIDQNQFASAVNVSIRGGSPKTRPSLVKIPFEFCNDYDKNLVKSTLFQGAYFSAGVLYFATGGNVFRTRVDQTAPVENLSTNSTDVCRFSGACPRIYFKRAGNYVVIQDGIHNPLIIGDNVVRPSNPQGEELYDPGLAVNYIGNHELVPGTIMEFGQSRLFVAYPGSNTFYASDPEFPFEPEQVLRMTEQRDLVRGGPLQIPAEFGSIVGMKFLQRLDNTTGDGPLLVFGTRGVMSFVFHPDRLQWRSTTVAKYALVGAGGVGPDSIVQVNSDMIFTSSDGQIRSFNISYQEFARSFSNTPISKEVADRKREDTNWMMAQSSATLHNNRVMFTTSPYRGWVARDDGMSFIREARFRGLLSLDVDALGSMRAKANPAYDDVWTGLEFLGVYSGINNLEPQMFIFARDRANQLVLYTLDENAVKDNRVQSIQSELTTRAFKFGSSFSIHELMSVELWISEMRGKDIEMRVYFRPDNIETWTEWEKDQREFCIETKAVDFEGEACKFIRPLTGASIRRLTFNSPPETDCDPMDATTGSRASTFQIKVEWTGRLRIDRARIVARPIPERVQGQCLGTEKPAECKVLDKSCDSDYRYIILGE